MSDFGFEVGQLEFVDIVPEQLVRCPPGRGSGHWPTYLLLRVRHWWAVRPGLHVPFERSQILPHLQIHPTVPRSPAGGAEASPKGRPRPASSSSMTCKHPHSSFWRRQRALRNLLEVSLHLDIRPRRHGCPGCTECLAPTPAANIRCARCKSVFSALVRFLQTTDGGTTRQPCDQGHALFSATQMS